MLFPRFIRMWIWSHIVIINVCNIDDCMSNKKGNTNWCVANL